MDMCLDMRSDKCLGLGLRHVCVRARLVSLEAVSAIRAPMGNYKNRSRCRPLGFDLKADWVAAVRRGRAYSCQRPYSAAVDSMDHNGLVISPPRSSLARRLCHGYSVMFTAPSLHCRSLHCFVTFSACEWSEQSLRVAGDSRQQSLPCRCRH